MQKILMPLAALAVLALGFSVAIADHHEKKDGKSESAKVGAAAPTFSLQDTDGKTQNLADYAGKAVVLEWINPDCPFVVRHYNLDTMTKLADKHKDVVWLGVATGPTADAEKLKAFASKENVQYPILLDSDGAIGKAYGAKTTPHMYIIDKEGKLVYAGAIDNDANGEPSAPLKDGTVNYVDQALTELASGSSISKAETKAYGCSVKYPK